MPQSVIKRFRNLLTKYTCPFPVTFVVVETRTDPSGLLMAVCFSSNSPSSVGTDGTDCLQRSPATGRMSQGFDILNLLVRIV